MLIVLGRWNSSQGMINIVQYGKTVFTLTLICKKKKKRRIELQLCYFTCSPFKHVLSCLLTTPTMEHLSTVLGITINSLRWGVGNYNWWTRTGRVPAGGYLWQIRITGRESKKEMVSTFCFLKVGCRWLAVMFLQCLVSRLLA